MNDHIPAKKAENQDQPSLPEEEKGSSGAFYEKWKDPKDNKMGNDISSELKIANSGGEMEGGTDKGWHMYENSEKGDEELK